MTELKKIPTIAAIAALFIASAPHFFFPTPLALKSAGNMNGFYGIAIWPAAVLAGFAFMYSVDFAKRSHDAWSKNLNSYTIFAILGIGAFVAAYSNIFVGNYPLITNSRPSFLVAGLAIFFGLRALEALFIHGIFQAEVLAKTNKIGRLLLTTLAVAFIYCGFYFQEIDASTHFYVGAILAETLFGALLFELGLALYGVVIIRALCGGIFIWFTQMFLF